MIPFSGTFYMVSWLAPQAQAAMYYSPFVQGMEIMRYGIFGDAVNAQWNITVPLASSMVLTLIGLVLCRRVRRRLVVE
jgi:capsular polysaccharide transport system permease protein